MQHCVCSLYDFKFPYDSSAFFCQASSRPPRPPTGRAPSPHGTALPGKCAGSNCQFVRFASCENSADASNRNKTDVKEKNAATGAYANPFYGAQCCHRFQRLLFRASPPICASSIARTGTFVNRLRLHRTLIESDLRKRNGKSSENPFTYPSIRCFHPPERLGCHLALFGGVLPN